MDKYLSLSKKEVNIILKLITDNKDKQLKTYLKGKISRVVKTKLKSIYNRKVDKKFIIEQAISFREKLIEKQTEDEKIFKALLKSINIDYKFQEIFYFEKNKGTDFYILDFYIPKYNIAIEIDGLYHNEKLQKKSDKERTKIIKDNGIKEVIRFTNDDVNNNQEFIKHKLETLIYDIVKPKQITKDVIEMEGTKYKKRRKHEEINKE